MLLRTKYFPPHFFLLHLCLVCTAEM